MLKFATYVLRLMVPVFNFGISQSTISISEGLFQGLIAFFLLVCPPRQITHHPIPPFLVPILSLLQAANLRSSILNCFECDGDRHEVGSGESTRCQNRRSQHGGFPVTSSPELEISYEEHSRVFQVACQLSLSRGKATHSPSFPVYVSSPVPASRPNKV